MKVKSKNIDVTDINEYLKDYSDFSFEIKVLKELNDNGYNCSHAGSYEDPITKKTREFDVRAVKYLERNTLYAVRICLAVECKNIRENFPILVHRIKRDKLECYQDIVVSHRGSMGLTTLSIDEVYSPYKENDWVGKSIEQIGRRTHDNELVTTNSELFTKYHQAIHSAYELIEDSTICTRSEEQKAFSIIIPMLIVPDGMVWCIDYDGKGNIKNGPSKVDNLSVYVDKEWTFRYGSDFRISHLEISQVSKMVNYIDSLVACSNYGGEYLDEMYTNSTGEYYKRRLGRI